MCLVSYEMTHLHNAMNGDDSAAVFIAHMRYNAPGLHVCVSIQREVATISLVNRKHHLFCYFSDLNDRHSSISFVPLRMACVIIKGPTCACNTISFCESSFSEPNALITAMLVACLACI